VHVKQNAILFQLFATTFLHLNKMAKREFTYRFTAHVPNDLGIGVLTSGINMDRFKSNPVVLKNHSIDEPVGTAEIISIEKNGDATVKVIIDDENDAELQKLCRDIDKKLYNGISMGLDFKFDSVLNNVEGFDPGLPVITESELIELSITPLPANKSCLRLFNNGKELKAEEMKLQLNAFNNKNKPQPMINKLLLFLVSSLKLAAGTTEDEALVKLQNIVADNERMKAENEKLEKQNAAFQLSRVTDLVEGAVTANKIKADEKETYIELAKSNYDSAKKILDGFKPHVSLASKVNENAGAAAAGADDKYKGWDMDRFRKEAPLELARIRKEEPVRFKELFNEKFAQK
jgi:hypothetical protein